MEKVGVETGATWGAEGGMTHGMEYEAVWIAERSRHSDGTRIKDTPKSEQPVLAL